MRRTLFATLAALSILGCVNKVNSQKSTSAPDRGFAMDIPVTIPNSFWGRKFYRLDPNFTCGADAAISAPGYRSALSFTADHQILEVDACTLKEAPLQNQSALELSRDGVLVGHLDRLFQSRQDPKSGSEPYIEGFCTNSLVHDDSGQITPVEMRLSATSQPTMASFSWLILGENYISLVTDNLQMNRVQSSSHRIYTAGPESGGVSVDVVLTPDPAKNGLYPAFYRMENGVAFDLYCRLAL